LILESPNPENIAVGTAKFYLDPTHHRPIPPALLAFLPEHYGFRRTKILRLQERPGLEANLAPSLMNVLGDVSPDYAVIAQKDSSDAQLVVFDPAFAKEYGVTLETLAARYDAHADARSRQWEARAQHAEASAQQSEARARQAEITAQHAEAHVRQLLASKSWRFTAPLRAVIDTISRIFGANK
jgi:O-antigen chain-terminating methyltransferase